MSSRLEDAIGTEDELQYAGLALQELAHANLGVRELLDEVRETHATSRRLAGLLLTESEVLLTIMLLRCERNREVHIPDQRLVRKHATEQDCAADLEQHVGAHAHLAASCEEFVEALLRRGSTHRLRRGCEGECATLGGVLVAVAVKLGEGFDVAFFLEERDDVTCGWSERFFSIGKPEAAEGVASQEASNRDYGLPRELVV
ncbi:MAG: hypothetical protein HY898_03675 [Deltaproteobacteria bacterium]|nr:hypothetical protein [Deltaproteobacteria bacterium]